MLERYVHLEEGNYVLLDYNMFGWNPFSGQQGFKN